MRKSLSFWKYSLEIQRKFAKNLINLKSVFTLDFQADFVEQIEEQQEKKENPISRKDIIELSDENELSLFKLYYWLNFFVSFYFFLCLFLSETHKIDLYFGMKIDFPQILISFHVESFFQFFL